MSTWISSYFSTSFYCIFLPLHLLITWSIPRWSTDCSESLAGYLLGSGFSDTLRLRGPVTYLNWTTEMTEVTRRVPIDPTAVSPWSVCFSLPPTSWIFRRRTGMNRCSVRPLVVDGHTGLSFPSTPRVRSQKRCQWLSQTWDLTHNLYQTSITYGDVVHTFLGNGMVVHESRTDRPGCQECNYRN